MLINCRVPAAAGCVYTKSCPFSRSRRSWQQAPQGFFSPSQVT